MLPKSQWLESIKELKINAGKVIRDIKVSIHYWEKYKEAKPYWKPLWRILK